VETATRYRFAEEIPHLSVCYRTEKDKLKFHIQLPSKTCVGMAADETMQEQKQRHKLLNNQTKLAYPF